MIDGHLWQRTDSEIMRGANMERMACRLPNEGRGMVRTYVDSGHDEMLLVVIDGQGAVIDRHGAGQLSRLHTVATPVRRGETAHMGDAPRQRCHSGTRGSTTSGERQRARRTIYRRLVDQARSLVVASARGGEWIVIGGTPPLVHRLRAALPRHMIARGVVVPHLHRRLQSAELLDRCRAAIRSARAAADAAAIAALLERTGAHTTGVVGLIATLDAIEHGAADVVFVTSQFATAHPADVTRAAGAARAERGRIVLVDGEAAARLDAEGGGIGAALRFALHLPPRGVA